jgi:serine/threonine protein phosphatase PrpC
VAKVKNLSKNPLRGLSKAFDHAYDRLTRESNVDMNFSGSTVVTCYLYQNKLYCCNVGDSRAVMGRHERGHWITVALSDDHKPSVQA